jgi:hypothetical protein
MKRVLLSESGLVVSKAGFDVTGATTANLSFDTRTSKLFSVFMQGSVALSAFTVDSNTTSGGVHNIIEHYTVNFGATFVAPPIVSLMVQDPMQTDGTCVNVSYVNSDTQVYYGAGSFNYGTGGSAFVSYSVTTTALTIKYNWTSITYSPPSPAFFDYSIMRIA